MQVAEIELYEILKEKIGDKEARTLVEYIETKVDKKLAQKQDILATKADLANVKADLETKISQVKADLETKISQVKADIIKWMFLFWIGQLASLIAILQIFFGK